VLEKKRVHWWNRHDIPEFTTSAISRPLGTVLGGENRPASSSISLFRKRVRLGAAPAFGRNNRAEAALWL
jgi:hypothetical protein